VITDNTYTLHGFRLADGESVTIQCETEASAVVAFAALTASKFSFVVYHGARNVTDKFVEGYEGTTHIG
jgi:hypothetical protein